MHAVQWGDSSNHCLFHCWSSPTIFVIVAITVIIIIQRLTQTLLIMIDLVWKPSNTQSGRDWKTASNSLSGRFDWHFEAELTTAGCLAFDAAIICLKCIVAFLLQYFCIIFFATSPGCQDPPSNLRDVTTWRGKWRRLTADFYVLTAHCPAQTRFNLNNKSLQVSPTRFAYNGPQSCCKVPPLCDNVTAAPVHYSQTLVRRRIKCHFDSFPIWSKFLLDKMQITAIIWQVIWWCRRYGGYA